MNKTIPRILLALLLIFVLALVGISFTGCVKNQEIMDLEVVPAKKTQYGTIPQEYWVRYRVTWDNDDVDYMWEKISRQRFAELKSGAEK